jgi:hypothetical protein
LRQEANFGCAICGVPVIDCHHIIPRSEKRHNDPEHMIMLCPNHHRPADDDAIERSRLYEAKQNPYNKNLVDYMFQFEQRKPAIEIGRSIAIFGAPGRITILRVGDQDIFSATYDGDIVRYDVNFLDKNGTLIAQIDGNERWANTKKVWDMKNKSNWFKLWNEDEKVGLKIENDTDEGYIKIKGIFYYDGRKLRITPTTLYTGNNKEFAGLKFVVGGESVDDEDGPDYSEYGGGATIRFDYEDGELALFYLPTENVQESEGYGLSLT